MSPERIRELRHHVDRNGHVTRHMAEEMLQDIRVRELLLVQLTTFWGEFLKVLSPFVPPELAEMHERARELARWAGEA